MKKFNILLLDDIEENLYALKLMIEDNFEVNIFLSLNVNEAISILVENRIDLILSDIQMPEIDGFKFAEYIKGLEELKDIPIIFITGTYKKEDYEKRAYKLGAIEYINKPIDEEVLVSKLKVYIELFENKRKDEEELNKKNEILIYQAKMASIGEMVGVISHQMKQPLNILALCCDDVKNSYEFNEIDDEFIDEFSKSTEEQILFLTNTIDSLRDFFNINKKKRVFKIKDSVNKTLELLEKQIKINDINIDLSINEQKAYGVKTELEQVLLNLITNSKDAFNDRKLKKRDIKIKTSSTNKFSILTIEDNAGGIKNKNLEKIFDPYFTTKKYGTGTGLYLVKLIIKSSFQGEISVENFNDGIRFKIAIPTS